MDAAGKHSWLLLYTVLSALLAGVLAGCTFPAALQGRWLRARDSKPLNFDSHAVSGHPVIIGMAYITTINCNVTIGNQYLLAILDQTYSRQGWKSWTYFCWELIKVTDMTYLLYEHELISMFDVLEYRTYVERLENDTTATLNDACTLPMASGEPTILYKLSDASATTVDVSTISQAALPCPSDIAANYSYVVDGGNCTGSLDFCVDGNTSHEDTGTCAAPSMYSEGGFLSCLTDFTVNGVKYVMLINHDNFVTNSGSSYRFVCMKLSSSSNVTVYPKQCSVTDKHDLEMTATATCVHCPAGHFINADDNGQCTRCAVGRYQERASQNFCNKCPVGSTTNTTGTRDIQACQAPPEVKITASVQLRYVLLATCARDVEEKTRSAVHARIAVMQSDWKGLCNDSACSNSHVTSMCERPTSNIITSVIAFDDISPTLSSTNTSMTLLTKEALLQAILVRDTFDLQGITGAVLSKSDVSVTVTFSCRAGYVPSSDTCVATSGGVISPELSGSICGGCIGLIAVVLLVI